jgi:hypothetical protein
MGPPTPQQGAYMRHWRETAVSQAGLAAGQQQHYSPEQLLLCDGRNQHQGFPGLPPGAIVLQQQQHLVPMQVAPGQLQMSPGARFEVFRCITGWRQHNNLQYAAQHHHPTSAATHILACCHLTACHPAYSLKCCPAAEPAGPGAFPEFMPAQLRSPFAPQPPVIARPMMLHGHVPQLPLPAPAAAGVVGAFRTLSPAAPGGQGMGQQQVGVRAHVCSPWNANITLHFLQPVDYR